MTETKLDNNRFWFGIVIDRNDPLKSGRVKARIFGIHDDETNVKKEDLPWIHPTASITSASIGHVGMSPTGVQEGSLVYGTVMDMDRQIFTYSGTIPRASIEKPGQGQREQPKSPDNVNDVAPNARGTQKSNVQGETNFGQDYSYILKSSIPNKAKDATQAADDPAVQFKKMLSAALPTIGASKFEQGQKILNLIKQVDANNSSGAIPSALDGMIQLKNITSSGGMMNGGLSEMFAPIVQQMMSGQNVNISSVVGNALSSNNNSVGQGFDLSSINLNSSQVQNIVSQIANQIVSQFLGSSDLLDGIGDFNQQMGKLNQIGQATQKLFSNIGK